MQLLEALYCMLESRRIGAYLCFGSAIPILGIMCAGAAHIQDIRCADYYGDCSAVKIWPTLLMPAD